jgi:hypothetical protein
MIFPPVVNRDLLLIRPKAPYFQWAGDVFDMSAEAARADLEGGAQAWLIRPTRGEVMDEATLKKHYRAVFKEALESWCTDEERWPRPLAFKLFQEWFDWEYFPMVLDLCKEPLVRE